MMFLQEFIIAYVLTNSLEFPILHFLLRKDLQKELFFLLLINLFSLSLFWTALPFFYSLYLIAWLVGELAIVFIEAVLISKFFYSSKFNSSALKISFAMNLVSAVFGLLFL